MQRPGGGAPDEGQEMQGPWGGSVLDGPRNRGAAAEGSRGRGQGKRVLGAQGRYFGLYSGSAGSH